MNGVGTNIDLIRVYPFDNSDHRIGPYWLPGVVRLQLLFFVADTCELTIAATRAIFVH